MKTKFAVILVFFVNTFIFSQEHAFKINTLALAFDGFEASYETLITKNNSLELIGTFAKVEINNSDQKLNTYGGEIKYKFFLSPSVTTFRKLYVAPSLSYATGSGKETNAPLLYKISYFSIGTFIGYQWVLNKNTPNGFLIDASIGAASYSLMETKNIYKENVEGLKPRFTLSLGYTF